MRFKNTKAAAEECISNGFKKYSFIRFPTLALSRSGRGYNLSRFCFGSDTPNGSSTTYNKEHAFNIPTGCEKSKVRENSFRARIASFRFLRYF
jgi:hypothetical protein